MRDDDCVEFGIARVWQGLETCANTCWVGMETVQGVV